MLKTYQAPGCLLALVFFKDGLKNKFFILKHVKLEVYTITMENTHLLPQLIPFYSVDMLYKEREARKIERKGGLKRAFTVVQGTDFPSFVFP